MHLFSETRKDTWAQWNYCSTQQQERKKKCNKFKFFASYRYIPISLITVQLQQILNLTLSSFLGEKRVVDDHLGNSHTINMPRLLKFEC